MLDQVTRAPYDVPEEAKKYADEQLAGHNRELAESGHTRHFKMGYVCFAGYDIEAAFAEGMLAERERMASCPTIKGWVARDEKGDVYLYPYYRPTRDTSCWFGLMGFFLKGDPFPSLRWEDEPIEVEQLIIRK